MDPFEYIVVLSSLILGLGIAQILSGAADVLSHYKHIRLCYPHTIMVIVIFIVHIQDWWETYRLIEAVSEWTLLKVIGGLLLFPILLFSLARMLFPTGIKSDETDLRKYYFSQWRPLFLIFLITILLSIWINVFLYGIDLGRQLLLAVYALSYMIFLTFRIRHHLTHSVFHTVQLIAWIIYMIQDNSTLVII